MKGSRCRAHADRLVAFRLGEGFTSQWTVEGTRSVVLVAFLGPFLEVSGGTTVRNLAVEQPGSTTTIVG